ncbi:ribosomal 5S rRNA E-loop binding protein Ctc/L25/TL5 [Psychromonas sp. CNPT3]|uniref:50S ribosomal protein L25/general stress protein Ctc n=1 Tax=Psychromonas sp. CNPT3 TaxID=314282 RepID=UPI00006E957F|nr:50S ribosomal protein L25/general stress protein Ctc [Psychromonas sp. CNPT3]AGH81717.1 ribosomal 5S rRNA E-loop binding protein Ctc/L25/TL5 [Psychromonas sp. CNPT3]
MSIKLVAQTRTDLGKGASRRLRHAELVPGIVYGIGKDPISLTFEQKELRKIESVEAFYSSILDLEIDGTVEKVVLKALQRHAFKEQIQHLDLLRVDASHKLQTTIPLHFINADTNEALKAGGVLTQIMNEVSISCLPTDLPAFITADLANLEMGTSLHISDLVLPKGVESVELIKGTEYDRSIASISASKEKAEVTDEAEVATAE